jgi:hypothetical protein
VEVFQNERFGDGYMKAGHLDVFSDVTLRVIVVHWILLPAVPVSGRVAGNGLSD